MKICLVGKPNKIVEYYDSLESK